MEKKPRSQAYKYVVLALANLACVIALVLLFLNYTNDYRTRLYTQNVNDITHLNESAATIATVSFQDQATRLQSIEQYIISKNMTLAETTDYIYSVDTTNENSFFELVGSNGVGYVISRNNSDLIKVTYSSDRYSALNNIFNSTNALPDGALAMTPEFTDQYTGYRSFALYTQLTLLNDSHESGVYTLMYITNSSTFLSSISTQNGVTSSYDDLSIVLMNETAGDYIVSNPDFKSGNLFVYIYTYNDLSLDERRALSAATLAKTSGTLTYKNSYGRECIFAYSKLEGNDWYAVTVVPISSFHNTIILYDGIMWMILILVAMLLMDVIWFLYINRKLRESVFREQRANAAKTDFLSRMSHDIRTPLNAVIGFAEIAKDEPHLTTTAADSIEKIKVSGKYLLGLINDILDMSKIESGKLELKEEIVDFPTFLNDLKEVFGADAVQNKLKLECDFKHVEGCYLYMDQVRTHQLYSNLLGNAIKFSDPRKKIYWGVTATKVDATHVKVTSVIQDHGCGMSPEYMKHLYQPFEQEANKYSDRKIGTGLGLAIVKRVIDISGGTISVKSALNKGTTFTTVMTYTIVPEEKRTGLSVGDLKSLDYSILKGKQVLLCEDNELNAQIASILLDKMGVHVDLAQNGDKGVEMFRASKVHHYDAILMDIKMPVMDGLEATRQIRKSRRSDATTIPIIAMTANAYDEDRRNSKAAGMNAHLAKPINPEQMYKTLEIEISKNTKKDG